MAATLFAVVVATLVLAGAALAQPPSPTGQVFHLDDTYVDPHLSSVCGFEVIEHDVGVITFTSSNDRFSSHVSVRETFTNPETGTSVVVLVDATRTDSFAPIDENGSFSQTTTFRGLNYKVFGAEGTEISAGRVVDTFTFIFDENGNLVDVEFGESRTPHFEHFFSSKTEAAICETLAQ